MKRKPYVPTIGTVSHGTLRSEDLVETFLDELCRVAPGKYGALKREARQFLRLDLDDADGSEIVNDLQDALSEHAPPFLYFGTTEGDGSDFGWWPCMEQIDELETFDDTSAAAAERHVGEFKVLSDHGNVEVYVRSANGRIRSILGIV